MSSAPHPLARQLPGGALRLRAARLLAVFICAGVGLQLLPGVAQGRDVGEAHPGDFYVKPLALREHTGIDTTLGHDGIYQLTRTEANEYSLHRFDVQDGQPPRLEQLALLPASTFTDGRLQLEPAGSSVVVANDDRTTMQLHTYGAEGQKVAQHEVAMLPQMASSDSTVQLDHAGTDPAHVAVAELGVDRTAGALVVRVHHSTNSGRTWTTGTAHTFPTGPTGFVKFALSEGIAVLSWRPSAGPHTAFINLNSDTSRLVTVPAENLSAFTLYTDATTGQDQLGWVSYDQPTGDATLHETSLAAWTNAASASVSQVMADSRTSLLPGDFPGWRRDIRSVAISTHMVVLGTFIRQFGATYRRTSPGEPFAALDQVGRDGKQAFVNDIFDDRIPVSLSPAPSQVRTIDGINIGSDVAALQAHTTYDGPDVFNRPQGPVVALTSFASGLESSCALYANPGTPREALMATGGPQPPVRFPGASPDSLLFEHSGACDAPRAGLSPGVYELRLTETLPIYPRGESPITRTIDHQFTVGAGPVDPGEPGEPEEPGEPGEPGEDGTVTVQLPGPDTTGELNKDRIVVRARTQPSQGNLIYQWEITATADPSNAGEVRQTSTNRPKLVVTPAPGTTECVRVRAATDTAPDAPGPWSNTRCFVMGYDDRQLASRKTRQVAQASAYQGTLTVLSGRKSRVQLPAPPEGLGKKTELRLAFVRTKKAGRVLINDGRRRVERVSIPSGRGTYTLTVKVPRSEQLRLTGTKSRPVALDSVLWAP